MEELGRITRRPGIRGDGGRQRGRGKEKGRWVEGGAERDGRTMCVCVC